MWQQYFCNHFIHCMLCSRFWPDCVELWHVALLFHSLNQTGFSWDHVAAVEGHCAPSWSKEHQKLASSSGCWVKNVGILTSSITSSIALTTFLLLLIAIVIYWIVLICPLSLGVGHNCLFTAAIFNCWNRVNFHCMMVFAKCFFFPYLFWFGCYG